MQPGVENMNLKTKPMSKRKSKTVETVSGSPVAHQRLVSMGTCPGFVDTTKANEVTLIKSAQCKNVGFKTATVILQRRKGESKKQLYARAVKELSEINLEFPWQNQTHANADLSDRAGDGGRA